MTTFVSMSAGRIAGYLAAKLADDFYGHRLNSKFGIEVRPVDGLVPCALLLSGQDAGKEVFVIKAGQRALLHLGTLQPSRYQAFICSSPALNATCTVQHPVMVEPKEAVDLDLVITAHKELDLAAVEWWVRCYLFE